MADSEAKHVLLASARQLLAGRLDYDAFLAKLAPKDRANAEKRVAALEAGPDPARARLWRRLACTLMTLSPHAAKLVGLQAVQFYVADGKYRMQVFALEDPQDGHLSIYCPDVVEAAVKAGVLGPSARLPGKAPEGEARVYAVPGSNEPLRVEPLDKSSINPAAHYKDMLGWNRKAVRVTLPPGASPAQVEAAEMLCAFAARAFPKSAAPAPTGAAATAPGATPAGPSASAKKGAATGK